MDSLRTWIKIVGMLFIIISIPLIFLSKEDDKKINDIELEDELYIEQIYFKNIEELNSLSIDQSLKFQDELTYYFRDLKKEVKEVEILKDSLKSLGLNRFKFKVKFYEGNLDIYIDKDKIYIEKEKK